MASHKALYDVVVASLAISGVRWAPPMVHVLKTNTTSFVVDCGGNEPIKIFATDVHQFVLGERSFITLSSIRVVTH